MKLDKNENGDASYPIFKSSVALSKCTNHCAHPERFFFSGGVSHRETNTDANLQYHKHLFISSHHAIREIPPVADAPCSPDERIRGLPRSLDAASESANGVEVDVFRHLLKNQAAHELAALEDVDQLFLAIRGKLRPNAHEASY